MGAVGKRAMRPILHAVPPGVGFVDAHAGLEVAEVVASFCVTSRTVQENTAARRGEGGVEVAEGPSLAGRRDRTARLASGEGVVSKR